MAFRFEKLNLFFSTFLTLAFIPSGQAACPSSLNLDGTYTVITEDYPMGSQKRYPIAGNSSPLGLCKLCGFQGTSNTIYKKTATYDEPYGVTINEAGEFSHISNLERWLDIFTDRAVYSPSIVHEVVCDQGERVSQAESRGFVEIEETLKSVILKSPKYSLDGKGFHSNSNYTRICNLFGFGTYLPGTAVVDTAPGSTALALVSKSTDIETQFLNGKQIRQLECTFDNLRVRTESRFGFLGRLIF